MLDDLPTIATLAYDLKLYLSTHKQENCLAQTLAVYRHTSQLGRMIFGDRPSIIAYSNL